MHITFYVASWVHWGAANIAPGVQEMASQELKLKRKEDRKESRDAARSDYDKVGVTCTGVRDCVLEANALPVQDRGVTDMFRCGKCGKRKTKYYQKQTRSEHKLGGRLCVCLAWLTTAVL